MSLSKEIDYFKANNFGLSNKKKTRITVAVFTLIIFSSSCIYLSNYSPLSRLFKRDTNEVENDNQRHSSAKASFVVPEEDFLASLAKCASNIKLVEQFPNKARNKNPRFEPNTPNVLIRGGRLWLGDHYFEHGDIYLEHGLISAIGTNLTVPLDTKTIYANGRVVTPGIVDMHSHMGMESLNGLSASDDTNEMTNPTTPYVRVLDAFSPVDPGIKMVASGGITSSLILPGSGNLIGGEAVVIKLRPVSTLSTEDMLIHAGIKKNDKETIWRYMKMACGENPKNFYGNDLKQMPMTRLGENYLFRREFEKALDLKRKQDDWCNSARQLNEEGKRSEQRYPEDLEFESLVALLRKQVNLNIHCYLPQDIEAMIRHSLEFDFEIAAFHHALSAWQVPGIIKRASNNITIATFADMWGYKAEAWDQNVHAPIILDDAGIPVALKSDHPVMNSRDLIHEAQKAYHYGFNEHKALQAVTIVPARSLKLSHRIGSIEVGKDADIVIWNNHPLKLGARPKHVIIDGIVMDFKKSWTKSVSELHKHNIISKEGEPDEEYNENTDSFLPPATNNTLAINSSSFSINEVCSNSVDYFALRGISDIYLNSTYSLHSKNLSSELSLVVKKGKIDCIGISCELPHNIPTFDAHGATIIPGIISAGVPLGLYEIQSEDVTQDGYVKHDLTDPSLHTKVSRAVDGLVFNGLHLQKAYKAGVTTAISQSQVKNSLLAGISASFGTGIENTILDAINGSINEEVALNFVIRNDGSVPISKQIYLIRNLLLSNVVGEPEENIFTKAVTGNIPVVVQVNGKDAIASILLLKQRIIQKHGYHVNFVILGGSESHLVAEHLKRLNVPVILFPSRCLPEKWDSQACLVGPPLTNGTVLDVLLQHGVKVGLASTDLDNGDARNLIWEAGWNLAHNKEFSEREAVGLVTWNLADIFGIADNAGVLKLGGNADFVVYNKSPFEFGTHVLMVHGGGRSGITCFPKQV